MPHFSRRQLIGSAASLACAQNTRRQNVILILADDLGYADLGFQGSKDIPTPNLDRLAKGGVRFTNGYVSHPFCSPTRAGIMTGRYQQRFGHEQNMEYNPRNAIAGLPTSETTLPQLLSEAGYATGVIGKWHLGAAPHFHPLKRGFREQFGFIGGGHDYFQVRKNESVDQHFIPLERDGKVVEWPEKEYLTDLLSREAAAFVRRHKDDPFFLYVAYNAPHGPLQAPTAYIDRFANIADARRRVYAAMVWAMDQGIGKIMDAIRETGLERDTLVIFLSDNGGPSPDNGSTNTPLRGRKRTAWEGGVRVPFIAHWPAGLPSGVEYAQPIISLDLLPTIAAAAGVALSANLKLDGVNLLPYVHGRKKNPPHERLFWRQDNGDWLAVREGRYKLVRRRGETFLHDLEIDVGESNDLTKSRPEIVARLQKELHAWERAMVPPKWVNPPVKNDYQ